MKLLDFYKSIISAGSMIADSQGMISACVQSTTIPVNVGEKRLVLPLKEHIANPDKREIVIFHPLTENILRSFESDVMIKYRNNINIRINMVMQDLLIQLVALSGSSRQLKPSHLELLSKISDADDTMIDNYRSLFKAMPLGNGDKCITHIFIKKNAILGGKTHRRGAIVSFPLYEELVKAKGSVYGVKMRKKDIANLIALLEAVFPGIEEKDKYSRASFSDTCPTLDALLNAVVGLAGCVNCILDDFGSEITGADELRYEDDWVDALQNLSQFDAEVRLLPMQAGNDGSHTAAVAPGTVPPLAAAPVAAPPLVNVNPAMPQAPRVEQWNPNGNRPVQYGGMHDPQQQPQQLINPNAPARVVRSESGLVDYVATVQNNPQLFPQTNPPPGWGMQRAPVRQASWERNDPGYGNSGGYGNNPGYGSYGNNGGWGGGRI